MVGKKPPRKQTPPAVETAVLAKSDRRCALCFRLNGDLTEKHGQIAHLDHDPSNGAEDNLAWMCLDHHSTYDSKTKQHKNYTVHEVKAARARLYDFVAGGKHLTPAAETPYLQIEADKKILRDFLQVVPSNGAIEVLRTKSLGAFFQWNELEDIERFFDRRNGPDHEFLDPELEAARQKFRESCRGLLVALGTYTFPTQNEGWHAVPREWRDEAPERFHRTVNDLDTAANAVCTTYAELVRLARKKLAV